MATKRRLAETDIEHDTAHADRRVRVQRRDRFRWGAREQQAIEALQKQSQSRLTRVLSESKVPRDLHAFIEDYSVEPYLNPIAPEAIGYACTAELLRGGCSAGQVLVHEAPHGNVDLSDTPCFWQCFLGTLPSHLHFIDEDGNGDGRLRLVEPLRLELSLLDAQFNLHQDVHIRFNEDTGEFELRVRGPYGPKARADWKWQSPADLQILASDLLEWGMQGGRVEVMNSLGWDSRQRVHTSDGIDWSPWIAGYTGENHIHLKVHGVLE